MVNQIPSLLAALDSVFLWAAADRVFAAQCLIALDRVCRSCKEGGLGVRCVEVQKYMCLQHKLLHRLHTAPEESWLRWVWSSLDSATVDRASGSLLLSGSHWSSLQLLLLLPLYRAISRRMLYDARYNILAG
jgi:hypothetical protein